MVNNKMTTVSKDDVKKYTQKCLVLCSVHHLIKMSKTRQSNITSNNINSDNGHNFAHFKFVDEAVSIEEVSI